MRCAKVERILPLYASRDLDARGSREIAAHLAKCESCRETEAGLRETREWVESAPLPPIDGSDFEAIRRGVWRRINAEASVAQRDRRRAGRLVLSGGLLAGALMVVLLTIRPSPRAAAPVARETTVSPVAALPAEAPRIAEGSPSAGRRPLSHSFSRARARPAVAAARPALLKIEFQTANPDVRIIWLVKKGDGAPPAAAGHNQEAS